MTDAAEPKLGFLQLVRADMRAFAELQHMPLRTLGNYINVFMFPGVMAVFIFRLGGFLQRHHLRPFSRLLYIANLVWFGCSLPAAADVGPGLVIPYPVGTGFPPTAKIGKNVRLFAGVIIGAGAYEDPSQDGVPTIGDGAYIFTRAQVMGPIEIGNDVIIGNNAMVTRSIPSGAIALGAPARVLRYRKGYGPDGRESDADEVEPVSALEEQRKGA